MIPLIGVEGRIAAGEARHVRLQKVAVLACLTLDIWPDELAGETVQIDKAGLTFSIDCVGVEPVRTRTNTHVKMLILQVETAISPTT